MKYLLTVFAVAYLCTACTKSSPTPQQPIPTPTPVVVATPTPAPVVQGKWCDLKQPVFSPCAPAFDTSVSCNMGDKKEGGCTVWECKSNCDIKIGSTLEEAHNYAHSRSNKLHVDMLDGSVKEFNDVILPSPMPPGGVQQMNAVEKADGFYLK